MTEIQRLLFALQDDRYRLFQSKLMPDVPIENVIGVRMPALRQLAKRIAQTPAKITQTPDTIIQTPGKNAQPIDKEAFINAVPHTYYEEKTLCGLLICEETDLGKTIALLDRWLPEVDNWATCDVVKPRAFRKAMKSELQSDTRTANMQTSPISPCPQNLLSHCLRWTESAEPFTIRFGINMLMTYFLDDRFCPTLLERVAKIDCNHYYVRMGVAWYFATALAKQYEATVPYLEQHLLPDWTHRKTIQKAVESFRISDSRKAYLKTLC